MYEEHICATQTNQDPNQVSTIQITYLQLSAFLKTQGTITKKKLWTTIASLAHIHYRGFFHPQIRGIWGETEIPPNLSGWGGKFPQNIYFGGETQS